MQIEQYHCFEQCTCRSGIYSSNGGLCGIISISPSRSVRVTDAVFVAVYRLLSHLKSQKRLRFLSLWFVMIPGKNDSAGTVILSCYVRVLNLMLDICGLGLDLQFPVFDGLWFEIVLRRLFFFISVVNVEVSATPARSIFFFCVRHSEFPFHFLRFVTV